ncbi:MAG: S-layer homology domain-containing protein [Clostridiales bacterium]|nr:S-layer homology domain-containing protein [Clostridiales bacterium]
MRNLKKFLALVLAMMMAFSLMVTANAANEKDNGTNKYADETVSTEFKEAVDVLYGMGIMTGDNGSFYGNRDVMRSEMAAVLYRLVTGDTSNFKSPLYASIAAERFSDVNESDWFAPYIGYCYSAGLIKGYDGKFSPWSYVNGYETLIMVLRAMGYGQNGEYEGAYWSVRASADGNQHGLLTDVDKSHYANTLAQNTKREVVASIVFNGAQQPTVTWTPSLGYNEYDGVAMANTTNRLNLSLGKMNFGLDYTYGIVVGNQSTGEGVTRVNVLQQGGDWMVDNYKYAPDNDSDDTCAILFSNWTTDLRLFGHEVKVWFNAGTTRGSNFGSNPAPRKTYAIYDEAVLTRVIAVDKAQEPKLDETGAGQMGKAVKDAGFAIDTSGALWNYSFGPTDTDNALQTDGTSIGGQSYKSPIKLNNTADAAQYYLVIANNNSKIANLIIALDLTVTRISQYSDSVWGNDFVSVNNGVANNYFGESADTVDIVDTFGEDKGSRVNILVDSLGTSSITTRGKDVVAVKITGTTDDNIGADGTGNYANSLLAPLSSTFYHELFELATTRTKVVIHRDPKTQTVTFDDGTTMKRSWLADTVADNRLLDLGSTEAGNSTANIDRTVAPTVRGEYTFTVVKNEVTGEEEYVFWSVEKNTKTFIYATYLDWQQPVASSTFTYPTVGVIDGKQVTRNIINGTENIATGTAGSYQDPMNATQYMASSLPKRDSDTLIGVQVMPGKYMGFYIDEGNELTPVVAADNNVETWKQGDTTYFGDHPISIGSRDANVGAVLVGSDSTTGTGLYLTNSTKIYVVSGTGTDTQEIQAFNGIKDLLGNSSSVTIHGDDETAGSDDLKPDEKFYEMIYWTQVASDYAQDYTTTSWAVDEIYIPEEAIERVNTNQTSLYFIGDRTATWWNNTGSNTIAATQFTMYDVNGAEQQIWIAGTAGTGDALKDDDANSSSAAKIVGAANDNFFLLIEPTGKNANDGQPIYNIKPVSTTAEDDDLRIIGQYVQTVPSTDTQITLSEANDDYDATGNSSGTAKCFEYIANNYGLQLASIGHSRHYLWDVSAVKAVVNLDEDTYPGVKDVATLNTASSLGTGNVGSGADANEAVIVSAVRNAENGVKLDVIFVNAGQTALCSH